jgi:hypothetical protein
LASNPTPWNLAQETVRTRSASDAPGVWPHCDVHVNSGFIW